MTLPAHPVHALRRALVLGGPAALAALAAAGLPTGAAALPPRRLVFPRDHGAHPDLRTEWWYITGHAESGGRRFGFQVTFFRSRVDGTQALQSRLAARQLLFAHAAITDLAGRRLWHDQRIAREGPGGSRAATHDTDLLVDGWSLRRDPACPVVVVRPVEGSVARSGVLVGVDVAGTSTRALAFAYRQASVRGLPLRVVHCIFDVRAPSGDVGPAEAGYDAEWRLLAETVSGMAEQYPDVDATTVLTRGLVDRTLVRLGEQAELVVVGTHRRGPVAGIVRGRTAAIVTEQSTSIVAVVPEPD